MLLKVIPFWRRTIKSMLMQKAPSVSNYHRWDRDSISHRIHQCNQIWHCKLIARQRKIRDRGNGIDLLDM